MYDLPETLPEPNEFGSYYLGERTPPGEPRCVAAIHRVCGRVPGAGRYMAFHPPAEGDAGLVLDRKGRIATFKTPQEALAALRADAMRREAARKTGGRRA